MLTIWGRKTSSNVQALMWCIGELGLPYERHDVGHRYGGTDTPEFLALNPNGTVPVLRDDDGDPLWETGAILRYLVNRYASVPFWPADTRARAQVDKWAEWSKINVAMNFTAPIFWRVVRTAPKDRDPATIEQAVAKLDRFLDIADAQLSAHAFLAGDNFTIADIQFGHILFRYLDIPIARKDRPLLRAYYDTLTQRPAFREHVTVSYEELRVLERPLRSPPEPLLIFFSPLLSAISFLIRLFIEAGEVSMLYAVLCYNSEDVTGAWSKEEDDRVMRDMAEVERKYAGKLGPIARLLPTTAATTLRHGPGEPIVIDGPFAETKEQLLGFFIIDCDSLEEAIGFSRELAEVNPSAGSYEIRPLAIYKPSELAP